MTEEGSFDGIHLKFNFDRCQMKFFFSKCHSLKIFENFKVPKFKRDKLKILTGFQSNDLP